MLPKEQALKLTAEQYKDDREQRERAFFKFSDILKKYSADINQEIIGLMRYEQKQPIVDETCSINMDAFKQYPSPISKEQVKDDQKVLASIENNWLANIRKPKMQEYYRQKYGAQTSADMQKWAHYEQDLQKGFIGEMVVTALLHKFLRKDFIVVRTAKYDDIKGGVDNLVIDKKNGNIICTFDEVVSKSPMVKQQKTQRKVLNGGAKVKYGLAMEFDDQGKAEIKKSSLKNVPAFFLRLTPNEFTKLIDGYDDDLNAMHPTEQQLFAKLLNSLNKQAAKMKSFSKLKPEIKQNLENFTKSLEQMNKCLPEELRQTIDNAPIAEVNKTKNNKIVSEQQAQSIEKARKKVASVKEPPESIEQLESGIETSSNEELRKKHKGLKGKISMEKFKQKQKEKKLGKKIEESQKLSKLKSLLFRVEEKLGWEKKDEDQDHQQAA